MDKGDVAELPVLYSAYIVGRGYVTVVENNTGCKITLDSVVLFEGKRLKIRGVEGMRILLDPPYTDPRQGIVTREPLAGKTIKIEL